LKIASRKEKNINEPFGRIKDVQGITAGWIQRTFTLQGGVTMKRKIAFMMFGVFVATLMAVALTPVAYGQEIKLTYANFPPAPTFPCVQMERWAKEVEQRTQGKVKVQTFPGGTLLAAKNIFDGVMSGAADIGNFAMSYQPGRFPVSEAIDLPLGFTSAKAASLTLYDLVDKYKPKEFEGVKILTLFTCPPANIMTRTPVKSLADLKGMELRVGGTQSDIIKRLGGIPVAMPQSDTPEALQKGVVKGHVSSMEVLKDFNYAAYTANATITNLWVVSFGVVMNKDKWASLPSDVKKVFDDLRQEQALCTGRYVDDHVLEAVKWSKEKYDLQMFELPVKEQAEIPTLLASMVDDYVKKLAAAGLPGEQIVKDVMALKAKYEKEYK
jgi:TRAP-type transport system periplasmic protein